MPFCCCTQDSITQSSRCHFTPQHRTTCKLCCQAQQWRHRKEQFILLNQQNAEFVRQRVEQDEQRRPGKHRQIPSQFPGALKCYISFCLRSYDVGIFSAAVRRLQSKAEPAVLAEAEGAAWKSLTTLLTFSSWSKWVCEALLEFSLLLRSKS